MYTLEFEVFLHKLELLRGLSVFQKCKNQVHVRENGVERILTKPIISRRKVNTGTS